MTNDITNEIHTAMYKEGKANKYKDTRKDILTNIHTEQTQLINEEKHDK